MFKRILIAFDTGASARQAVSFGIQLAIENHAKLGLVFVAAPPISYLSDAAFAAQRVLDDQHDRARAVFKEVRARVPADIEVCEFTPEGDPAHEIVVVSKRWRADLIVVGTHGAGRLESFLLGSTAQSVIHKAHCPVLVVRQGIGGEELTGTSAVTEAQRRDTTHEAILDSSYNSVSFAEITTCAGSFVNWIVGHFRGLQLSSPKGALFVRSFRALALRGVEHRPRR